MPSQRKIQLYVVTTVNFMKVQSLGVLKARLRYRRQTRTIDHVTSFLSLPARSKALSKIPTRISSGKEAIPVLWISGISNPDSSGTVNSTMLDTAVSVLDSDFIACNVGTASGGLSRQLASRVEVKDLKRNVRLTTIFSVSQAYPSSPNNCSAFTAPSYVVRCRIKPNSSIARSMLAKLNCIGSGSIMSLPKLSKGSNTLKSRLGGRMRLFS